MEEKIGRLICLGTPARGYSFEFFFSRHYFVCWFPLLSLFACRGLSGVVAFTTHNARPVVVPGLVSLQRSTLGTGTELQCFKSLLYRMLLQIGVLWRWR